MLSGGIPPSGIRLGPELTAGLAGRAGQTLQAIVQASTGGALSLRVAGQSVPLDGGLGLQAGQSVQVQVVETANGIQLRVVPGASDAGVTLSQNSTTALVQSLGLLAGSAERIAPQLPGFFAPRQTWLRQLVAAWFGGSDDTAIAKEWTSLLRQAETGGRWSPPVALASLLATEADTPEFWAQLLQQLGPRLLGERRLAGQLAKGAAEGVDDVVDLRSLIARLAGDEALLGALGSEAAQRFLSLNKGMLERLDRAVLAHASADDQRYAFWDLPVALPGFEHARVHWFGGRRSNETEAPQPKSSLVALDLELSKLGKLWITLAKTDRACQCSINATDSETVGVLRGEREALARSLESAGMNRPKVSVGRWHGDAARALAEVLEQEWGRAHG